jgi:FKBP-type peptidyl-prolyl cis-trans isomerase
MKTLHILIGIVSAGALAVAGNVTIPNTFQANTTAKAAEVNANFTAIKSAVNDNAAKITANKNSAATNKSAIQTNANDIATNKSAIQTNANDIATNANDIQTNATAIGQKVTNIAVAGGLEISRTDGNVTLKLRDGYVAVNGSQFDSFQDENNNCQLRRDWIASTSMGAYFLQGGWSNCSAFADVQIPQGAKIKKLTCRVKHNYSGTLAVRLYKQNREYTIGFPPTIGNIQKTKLVEAKLVAGDISNDTQEISGIYTPSPILTINPTYRSYYIEWDPPATDSAGNKEELYDCFVTYEY